jgi:hypothetical protein
MKWEFKSQNVKCGETTWASSPMLQCQNDRATINTLYNDEQNYPVEIRTEKDHFGVPIQNLTIPVSPDFRFGINNKHKRIFIDREMFGPGHAFNMEGVVIR